MNKFKFVVLIFISFVFLAVNGCKDDEEDLYAKEMETLKAYLLENNITTEPTSSGIYYIEEVDGTGREAEAGTIVNVNYRGYYVTGEEFDKSEEGEPLRFRLGVGQVIPGWDEGIDYMAEGGKATIIVPSDEAYGVDGYSPYIPAYTTLIFDVELILVEDDK